VKSGNYSFYVPERGDIIWIDFNPQKGHEQAERRPAIVVSPASYNKKVGLALICPITNQVKQYPFEVLLPQEMQTSGVVLADQVKSLDWKARNAQFKEKASNDITENVIAKIMTLLS
jgi:mRNA interferase MazF